MPPKEVTRRAPWGHLSLLKRMILIACVSKFVMLYVATLTKGKAHGLFAFTSYAKK